MSLGKQMKAKKSDILLDLLLLALLSVAAYVTSFRGAYQFDDFRCIVLNESLKSGSLSAVMRFSPGRFLVFLTFFLDQKFFPGSIFWQHGVNLFIHILNGCLLYWLLLLMERKRPLSFICAALFLLHPVQTQAVTYIVQRLELLCLTFFLLHFACLLLARGNRFWLFGAAAALVMGMFCKENMAVAPLAALAGYLIFFCRDAGAFFRNNKKYFFAAGALFFVLALLVLKFAGVWKGTSFDLRPLERLYADTPDLAAYFATQFKVWVVYLRLCFWPLGLRVEYDTPVLEGFGSPFVWGAVIFWLALFYSAFRFRKNLPWFAFGLVYFALYLAPAATLIPNGLYEHRLYGALPGVITAVVFSVPEKWEKGLRWISFVLIALFLVLTAARNLYWRDAELLWRDTLRKSPLSFRANANVGQALLEKERYQEALPYLERAVVLRPQTVEAHYNLACCLAGMGDLRGAKEELVKAKKLKSRLPEIRKLVEETLREVDQALSASE